MIFKAENILTMTVKLSHWVRACPGTGAACVTLSEQNANRAAPGSRSASRGVPALLLSSPPASGGSSSSGSPPPPPPGPPGAPPPHNAARARRFRPLSIAP
ncbi:hypothetical protein HW555_012190 [Spodoptera exigua]|uniref:Uncharacterized protein n=1 Tax=Spodoptera exigua TaxID=7107 RepID=A0A835G7J1_SPOEX|nr:hypothetical protein HW555_012190 [Spodoptera exigua]